MGFVEGTNADAYRLRITIRRCNDGADAGEMGCEYPYIYNVGGNISEGVSSGRRAARVICAQ